MLVAGLKYCIFIYSMLKFLCSIAGGNSFSPVAKVEPSICGQSDVIHCVSLVPVVWN